MRRFGFVRLIPNARHIPRTAIVLNPTSPVPLSAEDYNFVVQRGLVVIDCSWDLAENVFAKRFRGFQRRLPLLLASNPVNYGKVAKLNSAEAIAAALFISGLKEYATRILSIFSWGKSFLDLNHELLDSYSKTSNSRDILVVERSFFGERLL